jgi:hypothetical protein
MPYESAHDLPSFVEMQQQIKGLKLLRFLIPKDSRADIKELERQLKHLGDTVDRFYQVLGSRNWIFHDSLSVDRMAAILDACATPDEAERRLIEYYMDPEDPQALLRPVRAFPALRKRMHLIQCARDDYFAGRYYACVLVLLTVMDGFVNEFEAVRRGLHARDAEELDAFDAVVGHHMGLMNAHKTFRKSKGATSEEPVYELYRNGIMHGTLLNYDNDIVATKAWNRLFAIVDWAKARVREQQPPKPKPTWSDVWNQLAESARQNRALDAWRPVTLTPADAEFEGHAAYKACDQLLSYWVRKNYGGIAGFVARFVRDAYGKSMPRSVNEEYSQYPLLSYEIRKLEHNAASVCEIDVILELADGEVRAATLRWMYENEAGDVEVPPRPGGWGIVLWGPAAFLNSGDGDDTS